MAVHARQKPVPALTPRETRGALWGVLRAHRFYIFFTTVWNLISLPLSLMAVFKVFGDEDGGAICVGLFLSIFLVVGVGLFWSTLKKIVRDRWLLTYGMLAQGKIAEHNHHNTASSNDRRATRIVWAFEDALGQERRADLETFDDELIGAHAPGTVVDVLFDPGEPSRSVVPSLMRADFVPPPQVEDRRPDLDRDAPGVPDAPAPWLGDSRLTLLSLPMRARGGCVLLRAGSATAGVGYLKVTADEVVQVDAQGQALASVRWAEPFTVQLTAWPLAHGELELGVTLVQRGAARGRVRFQVELPQSAVDERVVVQQLKAPYLHANDLRRLWPALRFYLQARGEDLTGQLSLP